MDIVPIERTDLLFQSTIGVENEFDRGLIFKSRV